MFQIRARRTSPSLCCSPLSISPPYSIELFLLGLWVVIKLTGRFLWSDILSDRITIKQDGGAIHWRELRSDFKSKIILLSLLRSVAVTVAGLITLYGGARCPGSRQPPVSCLHLQSCLRLQSSMCLQLPTLTKLPSLTKLHALTKLHMLTVTYAYKVPCAYSYLR